MCLETECVVALQGHPRTLTLAPIESVHVRGFLLVINSNLCHVLPRYNKFSAKKGTPPPFLPNFAAVPLGLDCRCRVSSSEDPKLITRVITFALIQPIRPRYISVTDRKKDGTDGRTTYCSNTAQST